MVWASGVSGCLLFTDPINRAPVVTFDPHPDIVYRGDTTSFTVRVTDEDDPGSLKVRWHDFGSLDGGCDWVTANEWAKLPPPGPSDLKSSDAPFPFEAASVNVSCLCARATDSQGASGQACLRIVPKHPTPKAVITDLAGQPVVLQQAKCSQIGLSADRSAFLAEDDIQLAWTLDYSGTDPKGKQTRLAPCTGPTPPRTGSHQCFHAAAPGNYHVTLTITDTLPTTATSTVSPTANVDITILDDAPACLGQTSPELTAKLIILSRSPVLGNKYESRTFTVPSVRDDCEPFPARSDMPTARQAKFVWSVMDGTQGKTAWEVQANPTNANSFKVDQDSFPNARPGDTLGLRVEVRDTPTELLYEVGGQVCADASTLICCGGNACTGTNDCVRWTTWTVEFSP